MLSVTIQSQQNSIKEQNSSECAIKKNEVIDLNSSALYLKQLILDLFLLNCRKNRCPGIRFWLWCLTPPHLVVFNLKSTSSLPRYHECLCRPPPLSSSLCAPAGVSSSGRGAAGELEMVLQEKDLWCVEVAQTRSWHCCLLMDLEHWTLPLASDASLPAYPEYPLQTNWLFARGAWSIFWLCWRCCLFSILATLSHDKSSLWYKCST